MSNKPPRERLITEKEALAMYGFVSARALGFDPLVEQEVANARMRHLSGTQAAYSARLGVTASLLAWRVETLPEWMCGAAVTVAASIADVTRSWPKPSYTTMKRTHVPSGGWL